MALNAAGPRPAVRAALAPVVLAVVDALAARLRAGAGEVDPRVQGLARGLGLVLTGELDTHAQRRASAYGVELVVADVAAWPREHNRQAAAAALLLYRYR